MRMQFLARVAIAGLAMALPYTVNAASSDDWYAGVSAGKSENKTPAGRLGVTSVSSLDNEDSAVKVFGGYRLWDEFVAVEVSYADLGKTELSGTTGASSSSATQEIKTFTIGLAGYIPVFRPVGAVIHLGFSRNDSKVDTIVGGTGNFQGATDFEFYWGAGLQFDITKQFGARVELERFSVNGADVNLRSAGVYYRF